LLKKKKKTKTHSIFRLPTTPEFCADCCLHESVLEDIYELASFETIIFP